MLGYGLQWPEPPAASAEASWRFHPLRTAPLCAQRRALEVTDRLDAMILATRHLAPQSPGAKCLLCHHECVGTASVM